MEPSLFAAQLVFFGNCSQQSLIWNSCFSSFLDENVLEPSFFTAGIGCKNLGLEPGIKPIDFDFAVTAKKADFTANLAAGTEREN